MSDEESGLNAGGHRWRRRGRARPAIGMVTTGPIMELCEEQWRGVSDGAQANGCDLICFVGTELGHPERHKRQANAIYDLISPDRLDALIMWTTRVGLFVSESAIEEFARRYEPLPIISVEAHLADWPTVLMDNRHGMEQAVSHLIEVHGHSRIAFVRGPEGHEGAQERYRGYLDALARHGLPVDPTLVTLPGSWNWNPVAAAEAVAKMLDALEEPPDAIAAANDDFALGVLAALKDARLRAPEDVAVVGYDNHTNIRTHDLGYEGSVFDDQAATVQRRVNVNAGTPAFTTVRAPFYEMGWRAAELALNLVCDESTRTVETIPTELIVRRSCGCLPSGYRRSAPAHRELAVSEPATADAVVGNLHLALGATLNGLPNDWAERLVTELLDIEHGRTDDAFLQLLAEYVRTSMRAGCAPETWWTALFGLRRFALSQVTNVASVVATENLWLRAQLLITEALERLGTYRHMLHERRDQTMREAGQHLIVSRNAAELTEALVEELPRLGIPGCHVMIYTSIGSFSATDASEETGDRTMEWSRPLIAYEEGILRRDLAEQPSPFRSALLTPYPIERPEPCNIVAAPLFSVEEQLGFALFEVGPKTGWIYDAVQQQLSSALRGILMLQRERRALTAAEDARRRLELAHAELEYRVEERTAELARTNQTLVEEIAERERGEQRQATLENQLRHAQKMQAIGRLTGGIAHDFNNILTVINGNCEALLRRMHSDDPRRPEIEDISHAGERAANLTRQLLAFTRQQVLHPDRIDLNKSITKVHAMLERLIGEDVELTLNLPTDISPIWADAGQLEQIVFNLAANARDAMPDGGVLSIETDNVYLDENHHGRIVGVRPDTYVVLRVRDTGTGMDEATQAQVFEPYFTTKPVGKGTGLGLATVFGIVQQSGGQIDLTSAPGMGTTVEIYLPRAQSTNAPARKPSKRSAPNRGSETILLVEDDDRVRAVTRRFLEGCGYQVIEARNGRQALELVDHHEGAIDLVVTDVVMPKMGGPELVAELQRVRPDTLVLFISGYTDGTLTDERLNGTAALLTKPYTETELLERVRDLLDQAD